MNPTYLYPSEQELQALFLEHTPHPASGKGAVFGSLEVFEHFRCEPQGMLPPRHYEGIQVITLMREGVLVHKNSLGVLEILPERGIQLLSTTNGTSVADFNPSKQSACSGIRIGIRPSRQSPLRQYEQIANPPMVRRNELALIACSGKTSTALSLDQDAWVWTLHLERDKYFDYALQMPGNGIYGYVIDGRLRLDGQSLSKGDHFALADCKRVRLMTQAYRAHILLIEVPLA